MDRISQFSKLSPCGDGPFKIIKKINDNAYQLDLHAEYSVHPAFNITDLVPFIDTTDDEDDHHDLRANPLQGGGDDVTPPSPIAPSIPSPSPLKGLITRSMMKKKRQKRRILEKPKKRMREKTLKREFEREW